MIHKHVAEVRRSISLHYCILKLHILHLQWLLIQQTFHVVTSTLPKFQKTLWTGKNLPHTLVFLPKRKRRFATTILASTASKNVKCCGSGSRGWETKLPTANSRNAFPLPATSFSLIKWMSFSTIPTPSLLTQLWPRSSSTSKTATQLNFNLPHRSMNGQSLAIPNLSNQGWR